MVVRDVTVGVSTAVNVMSVIQSERQFSPCGRFPACFKYYLAYRCSAKIYPAAKNYPPPVTLVYRLYYPLCVSHKIDTWHIVYLSYKDPCPTISIHKTEIEVH